MKAVSRDLVANALKQVEEDMVLHHDTARIDLALRVHGEGQHGKDHCRLDGGDFPSDPVRTEHVRTERKVRAMIFQYPDRQKAYSMTRLHSLFKLFATNPDFSQRSSKKPLHLA